MKKTAAKKLAVLLAVLILAVQVVACGPDYSDSPYLGTWTGITAEYLGLEMGVEQILGGAFTFTLESNGKCTLEIAGDKTSGKWSEIEGGFNLADEFDFFMKDGVAILDYDGVTMRFEQE